MAIDLAITMDDRPGALAELCGALQRAGVVVEAICGDITNGSDVDHFLVDDARTSRRIIERAGCTIQRERDVLVVDLEDRPDAFGEVTRLVAEAGVNIDLIYLASRNRLVLGGDGLDEPTKLQLTELTRAAKGPTAEEWERLTPTEAKVVRLVARGLTNAAIAAELFVAPRTVKTHLEHVFKKLGVGSRVELAVKLAQRDIGRSTDEETDRPR
ncbi:MAG: LuxR C-terminal-related transcriptional regulator [Actinomycetota bacterium]|nr:LuxR C-terminal-related transcriptional regulator [Actinomycetota bacterium]